jgi:2-oxo-3-hexenedioate decarboxylase
MTQSTIDVGSLAAQLEKAAAQGEPIPPLTDGQTIDIETAYAIQDALIERQIDNGETIIGAKLGLTSRAKQLAMGVDEPVYAWLTDAMYQPIDTPLDLSNFIHPRVEPEIAFVIGRRLAGPRVTVADVLSATDAVTGALEIIDSRYRDFRFTLADAVADNASSAAFVLGPLTHPGNQDLSLVGCSLEINGVTVDSAAGAALLGHPAECVARLAEHLARRDRAIEPGWVVLAGGMTAPVALAPGMTVAARYSTLGTTRLHCAGQPS